MFRKVADRFAEDAIITAKERAKLNSLAKALEIDPRAQTALSPRPKPHAIEELLTCGTQTFRCRIRPRTSIAKLGCAPPRRNPHQTTPRDCRHDRPMQPT